jgi:fatty acid desaturase
MIRSALQSGTVIDLTSFEFEMSELGLSLRRNVGVKDRRHLLRIEAIGRACGIIGLATAWIAPNPISIFLLAQAMIIRFFIGHHIGHGAYERVPGLPRRFDRSRFGRGWRRFIDWPEWWNLEDWLYTHNHLHHPKTQSPLDADVMDSRFLLPYPRWIRMAYFIFATLTWKFSYYAPRMHRERALRDAGARRVELYDMRPADLLDLRHRIVRQLWIRDYLPYVGWRFVLPTLVVSTVSGWAAVSMIINLVLAELVHNAQTFICIRPSHCAADIPLFTREYGNRTEFYLQSVLGTMNYRAGGDVNDILHGWTNYQVEHHLWPSLPLLQYRLARRPMVAICLRHGVGYREAGVLSRYLKTARLFMGFEHQSALDTAHYGKMPVTRVQT